MGWTRMGLALAWCLFFSGWCVYPVVQAAEVSTVEQTADDAAAREETSAPSREELLVQLRAHILAKYGRIAAREPIPMDCQALQQKSSRSYMEEYALYRWWREHGAWQKALVSCEAARKESLAFDQRMGLRAESPAPYLTDKGELLVLLGRLPEAKATLGQAAEHLANDHDHVLESPYLTVEDRQRLLDLRQDRLRELQDYVQQLTTILSQEES